MKLIACLIWGLLSILSALFQNCQKIRQNLLFSATMPETISHLANSILNNPTKIEITPPATTVERIDQKFIWLNAQTKPSC